MKHVTVFLSAPSHTGSELRVSDIFLAKVVKWFQEKNNNLTEEYGKIIPSLAFYHIPAHAMAKYQDDYYDNRTAPGINGESVVPQGGGATEYAGQDTRFMQALLETPGLMATFSGHDHLNDW